MDAVKRPWWRRKRWIVALTVGTVLAYPLSFVPACWTLMRIERRHESMEWRVIQRAYRPVAVLLMASPQSVRDSFSWMTALGRPENAALSVRPVSINVVAVEKRGEDRLVVSYPVW